MIGDTVLGSPMQCDVAQDTVPRLRNKRRVGVLVAEPGASSTAVGSRKSGGEPSPYTHPDVDGGWAKVVIFAVFGSFLINSGLLSCVAVHYTKLLKVFGKSRSHTSWVGSLLNAFTLLGGPVSALFISRWGCRNAIRVGSLLMCVGYYVSAYTPSLEFLFFTYGMVVACGMNFVYAGQINALNQYFERYLQIATSLSMVGSGVGVFLLNIWTEHIIDKYGWRGSFIWNAGLSFQIFVLGSLIFPLDMSSGPRQRSESERSSSVGLSAEASFTTAFLRFPRNKIEDTCSILRNISFWLLAVGYFCQVMSTTSVFIIYKDFVASKGFEENYAKITIGIGIGDIVGRMSMGICHTTQHFNQVFAYSVALLLTGVVIMCHLVADTLPIIHILSTAFGVVYGMQNVLIATIPEKLFGKGRVTAVFGCILFAGGTGALIGAPLAGTIVDMTGKYVGVLGFSTAILSVGGIVMFICFCINLNKPFRPLFLCPL